MSEPAKLVEVAGLHKSYWLERREIKVLRGVNLSINRGERISIIGRSGSISTGKPYARSISVQVGPTDATAIRLSDRRNSWAFPSCLAKPITCSTWVAFVKRTVSILPWMI